jgi:hypothetical protein
LTTNLLLLAIEAWWWNVLRFSAVPRLHSVSGGRVDFGIIDRDV